MSRRAPADEWVAMETQQCAVSQHALALKVARDR